MYSIDLDLERGDVIEIMYRVWRRTGDRDELFERWFRAEIIDCEPGARPVARLEDGQRTEVPPLYDMASRRESATRSQHPRCLGAAACDD